MFDFLWNRLSVSASKTKKKWIFREIENLYSWSYSNFYYAMWKFKNFSGTHVLCETVKNCNFDSFQSSNSWSFENFSFENCSNLPKNSIQSLLNCLKLQFLISRKILLAEKLLIFHNYELTDILPCWLRGSHHFSWFCCYLDLWIDFPYFFVSWCVALIFVEFQWRPADFLQKFLVKSLYNLFWKLASF